MRAAPRACSPPPRAWPAGTGARARCRSSASWAAASAAATAASARCGTSAAGGITCGRVSAGRCSRRIRSYGSNHYTSVSHGKPLMDLSVQIGSLRLENPLIAASGCFGYGVEYADVVDLSTLGAIVTKGLFLTERQGHPAPRIVERPAGMLNAIGLQGIGVRRFVDEKLPELRARRATVIVNVCGTTLDEYVEVSKVLSDAEGVHGIELNISCPNIK